jgi:hypothetical protein
MLKSDITLVSGWGIGRFELPHITLRHSRYSISFSRECRVAVSHSVTSWRKGPASFETPLKRAWNPKSKPKIATELSGQREK